jgi:hypothetical protein
MNMKRFILASFLSLLMTSHHMAFAQAPPLAELTNGLVKATLVIPDTEKGYYRGTRFDWSGIIPKLEYDGHTYFLQRNANPDPLAQGTASGPVEDFAGPGGSGLNYVDARPGETWIKIGVGVLKRMDEPSYDFKKTYEFVDHGKWTTSSGKDWIEFTQVLTDPKSGYGYIYRKTLRLANGKPEMTIEHSLKNTGSKTIATAVLDHNFLVLDKEPTGPDFTATFPYKASGDRDFSGFAEIRGNQVVYVKPVADGKQAASNVLGYGPTANDYDVRVENHKTGAGIRIRGDRPLSRLFFWSVPTTVCPEAYIDIKAEPGEDFTWRLTYDFYVLPAAGN